jgi:hypothetical protein
VVKLVAAGVVTVTSTAPLPSGETAVMEAGESTVTLAVLAAPKCTDVTSRGWCR